MTLLDARKIVEKKIAELKNRVDKLEKKPKLVIIRIGDDFASGKYVANKIKRCSEVGIDSQIIHLEENITQLEVEKTILKLNEDKDITGILLQLPIPDKYNENNCIEKLKECYRTGNGTITIATIIDMACAKGYIHKGSSED